MIANVNNNLTHLIYEHCTQDDEWHMWYRIYLWGNWDFLSFRWGSCCTVFIVSIFCVCTVVCLSFFSYMRYGVVTLFLTYEFECTFGIYRPLLKAHISIENTNIRAQTQHQCIQNNLQRRTKFKINVSCNSEKKLCERRLYYSVRFASLLSWRLVENICIILYLFKNWKKINLCFSSIHITTISFIFNAK